MPPPAVIVALPFSYWIANEWLDNFAYTIDLEWWYFACGGSAALLIAWFTVGTLTLKAAKANPTECLKYE